MVKRKGKLLNSVLWKPFNSHYMAHIIKVPAFKINRCTIWSDRSTKVVYTGSSLMSAPFINVSGNKFYLNTDEFTSGSSKLPTFSATGKLRKSVYVFVLLFFNNKHPVIKSKRLFMALLPRYKALLLWLMTQVSARTAVSTFSCFNSQLPLPRC